MNILSYKKYIQKEQSEFSHRWACWANNHMGWTKMKKKNRRLAKRRMQRDLDRLYGDNNGN
jgi:hypothetical protein